MKTTALWPLITIATGTMAQPVPGTSAPTRDWGCEVLLCLSNPAGPTAVSACVPPIQRLWRHLARGRPFPTCSMASGPDGRSFARMGYSHYDSCPLGTVELERGQEAELYSPMQVATATTASGQPSTFAAGAANATYIGTGNPDGMQASSEGPPPLRVCIAGYKGTRQVWTSDCGRNVDIYESIYTSPAQASPRVIDVYIDNRFWHRVRW